MVENSCKLSLKLQKIDQKVLQRNSYFAHSEAILLSMLADSNGDIQAQAVNQILTIRMKADGDSLELSGLSNPPDNRGVDDLDDDNECSDDETPFTLEPAEKFAIENAKVRKFKVPKINFLAQSYTELIDWENTALSEPPLTLSKTIEELLAYKESPWLSQSTHATHKQLKEQCAWCQRHPLQLLARKQEMASYNREWRLVRFFPILKLRKSSFPKLQIHHELSYTFSPFVFMKIICHYCFLLQYSCCVILD